MSHQIPTKMQQTWLKKMAEKGTLTAMFDKPPLRVMNSLVSKGYCKNTMDTFFEITESGKAAIRHLEDL